MSEYLKSLPIMIFENNEQIELGRNSINMDELWNVKNDNNNKENNGYRNNRNDSVKTKDILEPLCKRIKL